MIFLTDCNNFYVSCERIFRPDLNTLPVVVLSNNDGCIISRSSEAKKLGIKMGEPVFKIKEFLKENNVNIFSSNFELYGEISNRIMEELRKFSSSVEIYSIDEAFLEIKDTKDYHSTSSEIVKRIYRITNIPVSVGVANTKTLSKVAIGLAKESSNNFFVLGNDLEIKSILSKLPVKDIWGIGKQYANFMNQHGIFTAEDFINSNVNWILRELNINVLRTREELRGISCYSVTPESQEKKSIRVSRSFRKDIKNYNELEKRISDYSFLASQKLRNNKKRARKLSVFIATNRFRNNKPSNYIRFINHEFLVPTNNYIEIVKFSIFLLKKVFRKSLSYKKAGVILSQLSFKNQYQMSYLEPTLDPKIESLMESIDYINNRFGQNKLIVSSQNLFDQSNIYKNNLSPKYMNSWKDIPNINI